MRVKLKINSDRRECIHKELMALGIEVSEDTDLILTEEKYHEIICRKEENRILVSIEAILYAESFGKSVFVYTEDDAYSTTIRLYELERILPPEKFIRISNSVIISRDAIKRIRPGLGQKFYLILKNGASVDVTRTYYSRFKEYYGF